MKYHILVIDDDPDVRMLLERLLSEEGYDVLMTASGNAGVEAIKRNSFDAVILDLKLPDISGVEVLEKIRQVDRAVGVIILTSYPTLDTAIATIRSDVSDYIPKPFDIKQLRAALTKIIMKQKVQERFQATRMVDVGVRIKQLRKGRQLSLDALAQKTSLSKSFLSELERKKKFPRLDTLQTIASALGVQVHFFFQL